MSNLKGKTLYRIIAGALSIFMLIQLIPFGVLSVSAATSEYPDSYTITVTDGENPIEGANVGIENLDDDWEISLTATTGSDGVAAFSSDEIKVAMDEGTINEASALVRVTMDGYSDYEANVTFYADTLTENLDVTLEEIAEPEVETVQVSVAVTGDAGVYLNGKEQTSITVEVGEEVTVKIAPAEGAYIKSLQVGENFVDVEKGAAYEGVVTAGADVDITAIVVKEVTVTASAGAGGTIEVNDGTEPVTVDEGSQVRVLVTPEEGYQIASVTIGGEVQTVGDANAFNKTVSVDVDTEISATFVKVYTVTVTTDGSGTVVTDPEGTGGSVTVSTDTQVTITATPDKNYRVSSVQINGVEDDTVQGNNDEGYKKNLTANQDYTVVITFAPNLYTVTTGTSEYGTIQIKRNNGNGQGQGQNGGFGNHQVNYNEDCTVTVTPNEGYSVASVEVNEESVTNYSVEENGAVAFSVSGINQDKNIAATFVKTATSTVSVTDLFSTEDAVRTDLENHLYVYGNKAEIIFTTDKTGIELLEQDGTLIAGGEDTNAVTLTETAEIAQIRLYYQADGELRAMWHTVSDADNLPLTIAIDNEDPTVQLKPDEANDNGFYSADFGVQFEIADSGKYSGIASVEYFVTTALTQDEAEEIDYANVLESQKIQSDEWSYNGNETLPLNIEVNTTEIKDSDHVIVWVKVTDRAGNETFCKTGALKVNCTNPKITSVTIDRTPCYDNENYYNCARTATVVIEDWASAFDETAATKAIDIDSKDVNGGPVATKIEWTHDGNTHTATITFSEKASYEWSISYTNKAGLTLEKLDDSVVSGQDVFAFSIDTDAPSATISIDKDNSWSQLLSVLTFGIWRNDTVTVTATGEDDIAPVHEIVYYKTNGDDALGANELEALYEDGKFVSDAYIVDDDEKIVVYARVTDCAGNTTYVGTDGLIVDKTKSTITITPEAANENGVYGAAYSDDGIQVEIEVQDAEPYSGIQTISYQVTADGKVTQEDTLYTFEKKNPTYDQLESSWKDSITVDTAKNNSSNVVLSVTVVDNAGNVTVEKQKLDIDITAPTISVTFDNNTDNNGNGYFKDNDGNASTAVRTATVVITERSNHFDADAATNGIVINAVDSKGVAVENAYTISKWVTQTGKTADSTTHTATITFVKDANYSWSIAYTDKAGNENQGVDTGATKAPFRFTIDTAAPTGTIAVSENVWNRLISILTFGIFSNQTVSVTANATDETSPYVIEYLKTDSAVAYSANALNAQYNSGAFAAYQNFSVSSDERFTVYLRITDYAGNYTYISTNGVIVDQTSSSITIAPEAANENGIYGTAYSSGIRVDIAVQDAQPYSGIRTVDYKIVADNNIEFPTQSGNLFTFGVENPIQAQLVESWNGTITVDTSLNNSSNVMLYVTVVDNAGNTSTATQALDIDVTNPSIVVSFDNNRDNNGNGYFKDLDSNPDTAVRTATVVITERTNHFDAEAATNGITVNAVDSKGNPIADSYVISNWVTNESTEPELATHTATITFVKDANYVWAISYTDKAGNTNDGVKTGATVAPFRFTIDTNNPTGTVKATSTEGRETEWNTLRSALTFGYWSKQEIVLTGTADDETSASIASVDYYNAVAQSPDDGTEALTKAELDAITKWESFGNGFSVASDEQFVTYIRITDLAGNYTYISTNGLIVDHNAPIEETIAPEITLNPEQPINGYYKGDVTVDIEVLDPLVNGTYSGLQKIWYEVTNMGTVTQTGILYAFTDDDPKQSDLLQSWTGSIVVDSKLNNSNDVQIVVYAQDNSLNSSDQSVAVQIDVTAPTIMISYDNNSADSSNYFKADRTATVVVTERNFDAKDISVKITNTDGTVPQISGFTKSSSGGVANGDETTWMATILYSADGDYTFDIDYTDLAGNACAEKSYATETVAGSEFTIDKTVPVIAVSYDNDSAENGNYYKEQRTATITITEHNLDPNGADEDRVVISLSATEDGTTISSPTVSAWSTSGDTHTATITYTEDALYTFDITVKDKAGNDAADFAQQSFYVDQTAPTLEITGVADKSANKGDVIPVITYSDTNYDKEQVQITLSGANRKSVELNGTYTDIHNGAIFTFENFANEKEIDDIYTLTATLTDKAGNTSTQTIVFSINRYGSTYALSEAAQKLNGTYVTTPQDVVITEVNADELSNIKVTLFKDGESKVLTEGTEYAIETDGGNGQWYQYTYTIFADNFAADGVYSITASSDDAAGNAAKNDQDTKDVPISFGIDGTAPIINIENLESKMTYAVDSMTVQMSVKDNLKLTEVIVELDGEELQSWSGDDLDAIIQNGGNFTFELSGNSTSSHELVVYAVDAAGNGQKTAEGTIPANAELVENFYVTTNLWVRYYTDKPLFFGSIGGFLAVVALAVFLVVNKRRKAEAKGDTARGK